MSSEYGGVASMSIEFKCPSCQRTFVVKEELAGRRGKCSACGSPIVVPDAGIEFEDFPTTDDEPSRHRIEMDAVAAAMEDVGRAVAAREHAPPTPGALRYKVLTLRDKCFGGKFDPARLEEALNDHANRGWKLKAAVTASVMGMVGVHRDEIVFILERGG
jgi:DNA-directed RNA polymerase subunit RPC12/RpoP